MTQVTITNQHEETDNNSNFKVGDMFLDAYNEIWMLTWEDSSEESNNKNLILISLHSGVFSDKVYVNPKFHHDVFEFGISRESFYNSFGIHMNFIKSINFSYTLE